MYRGKPLIVAHRPWWRDPIFPWGWYSLTMDLIGDHKPIADGYYRPNDGGGGVFRWEKPEVDNHTGEDNG